MREFNISSRTLDRDISEIRNALSEMTTFTYQLPVRNLIYDSRSNKYILIEEEFYGE